jgi:hypothetical protein
MDDGTSFAQDQDLWASIGDELKMGIPENSRIRDIAATVRMRACTKGDRVLPVGFRR